MKTSANSHAGFTLVEVLLATIIGTLVTVIALGTFHSVSRTRDEQQRKTELLVHGRYALNRMRNDLANFYRSMEPERMKLKGFNERSEFGQADRLIFYMVSDKSSDPTETEGDLHEVEYLLRHTGEQPFRLLRRYAPVRDEALGSTGGEQTVIAGPVRTLQFVYFDGQQWLDIWQQQKRPPRLMRISLVLADPQQPDLTVQLSQVVSLKPLPGSDRKKSLNATDVTINE